MNGSFLGQAQQQLPESKTDIDERPLQTFPWKKKLTYLAHRSRELDPVAQNIFFFEFPILTRLIILDIFLCS